jgi:hypothetical protein
VFLLRSPLLQSPLQHRYMSNAASDVASAIHSDVGSDSSQSMLKAEDATDWIIAKNHLSNAASGVASAPHSNVGSGSSQSMFKAEDVAGRIIAKNDSEPDTEDDSSPESESLPSPKEWNNDPMEWESWPSGRPGPYVSSTEIQRMKKAFLSYEKSRDDWSRTKEDVFHIAEFSATGKG